MVVNGHQAASEKSCIPSWGSAHLIFCSLVFTYTCKRQCLFATNKLPVECFGIHDNRVCNYTCAHLRVKIQHYLTCAMCLKGFAVHTCLIDVRFLHAPRFFCCFVFLIIFFLSTRKRRSLNLC